MPLKTNIGVSRKVADNNYGSRGCSVNLEVELDSSLIQEPERLQERIRQIFRLAQQSVDEELSRQNAANGSPSRATNGATNNQAAQPPFHASPPPRGCLAATPYHAVNARGSPAPAPDCRRPGR